jgi:hypothetical protein
MTNSGLFSAIWLHLPGTTGGIHVVYSIIEPLIDKYIKAVKPLQQQGTAASQKTNTALQLLVTLRLLNEDTAVMIAENIADSWMILPVPLLIVTPGFIVRGGCVYTGLLVPALNSAKALAHVDNKVRCVTVLLTIPLCAHHANVLGLLLTTSVALASVVCVCNMLLRQQHCVSHNSVNSNT